MLRHQPESIGLSLDPEGWADISTLIRLANQAQVELDSAHLLEIVTQSDKQRFAISADGLRIRANQGHSIAVDLNLSACTPPVHLFHGTARRFLQAILSEGLSRRDRQHVHLTENKSNALAVGSRYGEAVLLQIEALAMHRQGQLFYLSENQVWLVDSVPSTFILPLEFE